MTCVLQSVRVVQRNLVYVVGLAMDICYEDVLRGSEFFGQFGKPIKARRSRHFLDPSHSVQDWSMHDCHVHVFHLFKLAARTSVSSQSK